MGNFDLRPELNFLLQTHRLPSLPLSWSRDSVSTEHVSWFGDRPLYWFKPFPVVKVGERSFGSGLVMDDTLAEKKRELYQAVEGINKGIFRLPSAKKFEIESLNLRALNAIWVSPLSGKQVPKLNPFHSSHFFSYGNGRIRTFPSQGTIFTNFTFYFYYH
ncbi:hypothetical protein HN51_067826 [Arachis hypogaea]